MKRRCAIGLGLVVSVVGPLGPTALAAGDPERAPSSAVVVTASDGFDWSDAAVGAAAGAGAVLAAAGAMTLARNK